VRLALVNDLLDAIERVAQHVLTAARLPKKRRDELLHVLSETYKLLDSVLLMVINGMTRVIDRAERGEQEEFARELSKLRWGEEWLERTREMSLSSGLRRMHAEMKRGPTRLLSRKAVKDWDALKHLMDRTMLHEDGLAHELSALLGELSSHAEDARASEEGFSHAWSELREAREALDLERQRLIAAEVGIYKVL
jgi:hypothetical protein